MKIAVWNTAFLGDAVLTLPLLLSLKRAWPEAQIDFYVRKGFESLFTAQAEFQTFGVDKKKRSLPELWRLGRKLAACEYDIWISPHTSARSSLMALCSRAKQRIGYREATASQLVYTRRVPRCFAELEEVERLLGLLQPMGVPAAETWPRLTLPRVALNTARNTLASLPRPLVGLHPGSVWPTKRWPAASFAELAQRIVQAGYGLVLFAGPGEEDAVKTVLQSIPSQNKTNEAKYLPQVLNMAGKTSLVDLAALIGQLDLYVSNDSGPMHLAWVQRVPTLALFGPTTRALGFCPRGQSRVLEVDLPCRPCGLHGHHTCPQGHHKCMNDLSVPKVWEAMEYIFAQATPTKLPEQAEQPRQGE